MRASRHPGPADPYRSRRSSHRGGVLVTAKHFLATAARPAGFADRIEIKVTPLGRIETHTAAIERGNSDLTWLRDFPLRGHLTGPPWRAPPAHWTAPRWPWGTWMFLNVSIGRLFDDPRVRRALNFAVDRASCWSGCTAVPRPRT